MDTGQTGEAVVVARCPLRVSFAGGGSDNDWFTNYQSGAVLSGAISSYVHARVRRSEGGSPTYGDLNADSDQVGHTSNGTFLHEHAWEWFRSMYGISQENQVSISTSSDVPRGSGLGASSALMAAILGALYHAFQIPVTRSEVARAAYFVERQVAGVTGGYQDHYAAVYGSLNHLQFHKGGSVSVDPLSLAPHRVAAIESRLTLIFSGTTRESADIIANQYAQLAQGRDDVLDSIKGMVELAGASRDALLTGDLDAFSIHVREAAANKRRASPASYNKEISAMCTAAIDAGADVCKVSGAGGGGFLLAISKPELKPDVEKCFWEMGFQPRNLTFDHTGLLTWIE